MAVAALVFASYPESTLGPYQEVVQFLACGYQTRSVRFATHLYVTSDVAMAAGREMGGYPKKIARIRIRHDLDKGRYRTRSAVPPASGSPRPGSPTCNPPSPSRRPIRS